MRFFKTTELPDEKLKINLFLTRKKSLQLWWQEVRDYYTLSCLSSHQTRQLDARIASLSALIDNYQAERAEDRKKALQTLYTHVRNWLHMHAVKRTHSERQTQVQELASWLQEQLGEQDLPERILPDAENENPYDGVEIADQDLYQWWMSMSKLGWFSWRSAATKELDFVIRVFSRDIIIDKVKALQQLMDAVEVWKAERKDVSRRLPMVEALEQHIAQRITDLQNEIPDEYDEKHSLWFSK
ncbi:hypothetical protein [Legionella cardiaca]|uniref:Uncharacterized protein n=1 Tax=Legionella cardiaca TaxID=1071983 RepID=A0ABY8AQN0_9GAMM|nr:hypothetical protein [Legionella cardiaca]WED42848.1 hypothetical protein PXX05_13235 [Legionella cardiaca]